MQLSLGQTQPEEAPVELRHLFHRRAEELGKFGSFNRLSPVTAPSSPAGRRFSAGCWVTSHPSRSKIYKKMVLIAMKRLLAFNGRGSYEDRTEMLKLIVDPVEASISTDNPDWSIDDQVTKDIQLIDAIAKKQAQIFSEERKLFPTDVQIQSRYPL